MNRKNVFTNIPPITMKNTLIALVAVALVLTASATYAQNGTWNANAIGTYNWSDAANWTSSTIAGNNTTTDNTGIASFVSRTGAQTVTVDSNRNVFGIDFAGNSNAYTLSGGNILLSNGGFLQTSGGGSGHTDTINSAIEIQGIGGNATISSGSSTAARPFVIGGNVSGVSTSGNTTLLTLGGTNTSASNAISGNITNGSAGGNLRVVKSGTGTWSLSQNNAFTGGVSLEDGTLISNSAFGLGVANGTVSIGSTSPSSTAASLLRISTNTGDDVNRYAITIRSTNQASATRTINSGVAASKTLAADIQIGDGSGSINSLTLANYITIRGAISEFGSNAGNLIVDAQAAGPPSLAGITSNTYTGTTTIQNGTLIVSKNGSAISIPGNLTIGTATSSSATGVRIDGVSGNGLGALAATSVVTFSSNSSFNASMTLNNQTAGATITFAGLQSTGTNAFIDAATFGSSIVNNLGLSGNGTYSYAGTITVSGNGSRIIGVTKSGTGTQAFSGLNTYTGNTTINSGLLSVTTLANGGSASGIGAAASTASTLVINGGTLRYTGAGNSTDRNITIGTSGATLDASGSAALSLTGSTPVLSGTNTARTLTLTGNNTGLNSFAAGLANNGTGATSVTKNGTGTWSLTGTNTYTGNTTVSAGTLLINGSTGASSLVNVASVAAVGGNGTINGNMTLASGALFSFDTTYTLTLNGTLSLNNSFGVASLRSLSGGAINWSGVSDGTYTLLNTSFVFNAGNITNFGIANAFDIGGGRSAYFTNGSLNLTVVPEPSTWFLLTSSLATLLIFRRRRSPVTHR